MVVRSARSVGAAVLIVVGVLCLVLSPPAVWTRNLVLDTDRYVQTLAPVASDRGVQDAVIAAVDRQVTRHLDMNGLVEDALSPRAAKLLGAPLENAVENVVHRVTTRFVRSDAFQKLWVRMNRVAHTQVDRLLTGQLPEGSAVQVSEAGDVTLDLSTVVNRVKARLVAAGITVAAHVPAVGATIEIANVHGLLKARKAIQLLDTSANWLPWIGLALIVLGVLVARRRRRAVVGAALGLCAGMIVFGLGLLIARHFYLGGIPPEKLPPNTAGFLFDTLVRFLRDGIRLVLVVALLIALGAWISGPSGVPVSVRRFASTAPQALGSRLSTGSVGSVVARYAMALRIGVIAFGGFVLVVLNTLSATAVIVVAAVVIVLLLVLELLRTTRAA